MRPASRAPRVLILVENETVPFDCRVWLQCQALVAAGYCVSVISPKAPGDPRYEVVDGVHLYKYRAAPGGSSALSFLFEYAYSWVTTALLSVRVLLGPGFDVLQACNPPDTYFVLAAGYKLLGKRFLFDQHDLSPEIYALRFPRPSPLVLRVLHRLERLCHQTADHVITVNESVRALLIARTGSPPDKVSVVRNGPDLRRLHRVEPRPELRQGKRYLCCYLGVIGPQDGVDVLLRAIHVLTKQFGRDDCHFLLMGFGDHLEELKQLATDLGIQDIVTFTGRVGDEEIRTSLSSADVGLSPDPNNAFNDVCTMIKALEYMTFGLPMVSFDLKETRVSAGEAAIYVQGSGPEAYAAAIAELLDSPERREHMRLAGRRRVEEALSWDHQKFAYLQVFDRLLSREPATQRGVRR
jgi:glycosyltransferase involved in cell wall biosynthesis